MRPLTLGDLPACLDLARDRDWLPEEHKWRLLFEVGTVYGLRDGAGDLAGTGILTQFGPGLAAIGMVLVAKRYGRRGIGRQIMTRMLAETPGMTVFLYATRYGQPLYEDLGFEVTGMAFTHVGQFAPPPSPVASRRATSSDWPAIRRLDTEVTGADRAPILDWLARSAIATRVIERDGEITGYGAALANLENVSAAPIIAADVSDARVLIRDLSAAAGDLPLRLDLDGRFPELREWATRHGASLRSSTTLMVRGGHALPGDRGRWFVPLLLALG